MIILHQHDGTLLALDLFEHGVRELAIDGPVGLPVLRAKGGPRMRDVTQGPQTLIGKPKIETLLFFVREPRTRRSVYWG